MTRKWKRSLRNDAEMMLMRSESLSGMERSTLSNGRMFYSWSQCWLYSSVNTLKNMELSVLNSVGEFYVSFFSIKLLLFKKEEIAPIQGWRLVCPNLTKWSKLISMRISQNGTREEHLGWASDSRFCLGSWSSGREMEPCVSSELSSETFGVSLFLSPMLKMSDKMVL